MSIKRDTNQQFYRKIHRRAKQKRFPLRAMFELTYRCNFNCRHCYIPESYRKESEKKDLKTDEVFFILDQLKELNCLYLGFTGGEPFIRRDFLEIIGYAKKSGFEIAVCTNGSLIDKKTADELKKLRLNKIDITVNSLEKESFGRISQAQGQYGKVYRAIELLRERNIPLGFKSCVLKENEDEIGDITKFAKSYNIFHRVDDILMPRLDGSKEPYKYRGTLKGERYLPFKCGEADFLKKARPSQKMARLFDCGVGLHNLTINPFGELKMCINIDYPRYKVLENSLRECWERLKELVDSIKADERYKCNTCGLEPYCKWCPARAWYEDGGFTSCEPESKTKAEAKALASLTA